MALGLVGGGGAMVTGQIDTCITSQNKNYRDGKNANGRFKSANTPSKLNNKGCPLICIKDQTIPFWIFQQA